MGVNHILWVNQEPRLIGGCELYIYNTVKRLNERGIRSSFLYDPTLEEVSTPFMQAFEGAYPMVDLPRQIREIAPDAMYIHRLRGIQPIREMAESGVPSARFFHDFHLFCLRKYKFKTLSKDACEDPIGMRCYPCLGFVNKSDGLLPISLTTVGGLRNELRANQALSAFVVGSEFMADHAVAHGFDRNRIRVIPLFAPPPGDLPDVQREDDLLLYIGQIIRGKGLDTALRALALTDRPARLVVAGTGPQEEEFKALSRDLGLNGRVEFVGKIAHDKLTDYYLRALCTLNPSRTPETFGLVGPEAHSHGTPIIAADVGGVREWLVENETGFGVPSNNPEALADAMNRMLKNPAKAAAMGAEGKRRYHERFRPEHHVDGLVDFFNDLTAKAVHR